MARRGEGEVLRELPKRALLLRPKLEEELTAIVAIVAISAGLSLSRCLVRL
jgi:hypothetical protein